MSAPPPAAEASAVSAGAMELPREPTPPPPEPVEEEAPLTMTAFINDGESYLGFQVAAALRKCGYAVGSRVDAVGTSTAALETPFVRGTDDEAAAAFEASADVLVFFLSNREEEAIAAVGAASAPLPPPPPPAPLAEGAAAAPARAPRERAFVGISTLLSWASTPLTLGEDGLPVPLSAEDEPSRRPGPAALPLAAAERAVLRAARPGRLRTHVVVPGVLYGAGEADYFGLHGLFQAAWEGAGDVPLYGPGTNRLPLAHVTDVARAVAAVAVGPAPPYVLAVDDAPAPTLGEVTEAVASAFGLGNAMQLLPPDEAAASAAAGVAAPVPQPVPVAPLSREEAMLLPGREHLLLDLPLKRTLLEPVPPPPPPPPPAAEPSATGSVASLIGSVAAGGSEVGSLAGSASGAAPAETAPPAEPAPPPGPPAWLAWLQPAYASAGLLASLPAVAADYLTTRALRPKRVLLRGPPGAGLEELGAAVAKAQGLVAITPSILLDEILPSMEEDFRKAADVAFAAQAKAADEAVKAASKGLAKGAAPPAPPPAPPFRGLGSTQVEALVRHALTERRAEVQGYVLAGFPESSDEAWGLFTQLDPNAALSEEEEAAKADALAKMEADAKLKKWKKEDVDAAAKKIADAYKKAVGVPYLQPSHVLTLRPLDDHFLEARAVAEALAAGPHAAGPGEELAAEEEAKKAFAARYERYRLAVEPKEGGRADYFAAGPGAAAVAADVDPGDYVAPSKRPQGWPALRAALEALGPAANYGAYDTAAYDAEVEAAVAAAAAEAAAKPPVLNAAEAAAAEAAAKAEALAARTAADAAAAAAEAGPRQAAEAALAAQAVYSRVAAEVMPVVAEGLLMLCKSRPAAPVAALAGFLLSRGADARMMALPLPGVLPEPAAVSPA